MRLTGTAFAVFTILLAVLAFLGALAAMPHLSRRSPSAFAARGGALLAVNVFVLLAVAVQLNDQFLFFADWSDLRGALGGHVVATGLTRGGNSASAAGHAVAGTAAVPAATLPPLPAAAKREGAQLVSGVTGPLSGLTGTIIVRLPPGYSSPAHAKVRYPVIETFNGYPGAPAQWMSTMHLPQDVDAAVAARQMRQVIIVSPQVEFPPGVDTECVDGAPGPAVETWLTRDVPNWVARTYRVAAGRSSWATIGLSTGGWCAAMTAMLHPAQYSAAIVMGGYFQASFEPSYEGFAPGSVQAKRYDLLALARKPPPTAMWLETSHSDPTSYSSSSRFLALVKPPLSVDAVVLRNAGHRIGVWARLLPRAVQWLGHNVPGFAPGK